MLTVGIETHLTRDKHVVLRALSIAYSSSIAADLFFFYLHFPAKYSATLENIRLE